MSKVNPEVYSLLVQVEKLQVALRQVTADRDALRDQLVDSNSTQQECLQALLAAREQLVQFQKNLCFVRDNNQQLVEENARLQQQVTQLQQQLAQRQHGHQHQEQHNQVLGLLGPTWPLGLLASSSTNQGGSSSSSSRSDSCSNASSSAGSDAPGQQKQQQQPEQLQPALGRLLQQLDRLHKLPPDQQHEQGQQQHGQLGQQQPQSAEQHWAAHPGVLQSNQRLQCSTEASSGQHSHDAAAPAASSAPEESTDTAICGSVVCLTQQDMDYVLEEIQHLQQRLAATAAKLDTVAPAAAATQHQHVVYIYKQQQGHVQQLQPQPQQCESHTQLQPIQAQPRPQQPLPEQQQDGLEDRAQLIAAYAGDSAEPLPAPAAAGAAASRNRLSRNSTAAMPTRHQQQCLAGRLQHSPNGALERPPWNYQKHQQQQQQKLNVVRLRKQHAVSQLQQAVQEEEQQQAAALLSTVEAVEQLQVVAEGSAVQLTERQAGTTTSPEAEASANATNTAAAAVVGSSRSAPGVVNSKQLQPGSAISPAGGRVGTTSRPWPSGAGPTAPDPAAASTAAAKLGAGVTAIAAGMCMPSVNASNWSAEAPMSSTAAGQQNAAGSAAAVRYMQPVTSQGPRLIQTGMLV